MNILFWHNNSISITCFFIKVFEIHLNHDIAIIRPSKSMTAPCTAWHDLNLPAFGGILRSR
jgi:hypothetical protein